MAYPLPKFHFLVKWDPGVRAGFTEVTGLDMQIEAIEYREGSSPEYSKIKMPGMRKFSNITLKRGTVAGDSDFYKWVQNINLDTAVERRDITISLLDETHAPVGRASCRERGEISVVGEAEKRKEWKTMR